MTALQTQYNQLLVDRAKLAETERSNKAHEAIQSRQAGASEKQAAAASKQANVEESKFMFGKNGPLGIISDVLTSLFKGILGGGNK